MRGCACRGTAGVAHVSCLAEQVRILCDEAAENHLDMSPRWVRWHTCSLCEQSYHGRVLRDGVGVLEDVRGSGGEQQSSNECDDGARERLVRRRPGGRVACERGRVGPAAYPTRQKNTYSSRRGNLANSYQRLGRAEAALNMYQNVYSGRLRIFDRNIATPHGGPQLRELSY